MSDAQGKVTYGVSTVGTSGSGYKLTADYVNSDTVNKAVWIRKTMQVRLTEITYDETGEVIDRQELIKREPVSMSEGEVSEGVLSENRSPASLGGFLDRLNPFRSKAKPQLKEKQTHSIPGTEIYEVNTEVNTPVGEQKEMYRANLMRQQYEEFNVPIYVGIGLRIVAEGFATSADANISGIGVISVEAEAKRLSGSLTVQTLGVNSQAVASALPVQSELSRVTAENAFVAIGSIKAMLHQKETIKFPRVVGLYLPFPGGKPLVNSLISELSRTPVAWCPSGYSTNDR